MKAAVCGTAYEGSIPSRGTLRQGIDLTDPVSNIEDVWASGPSLRRSRRQELQQPGFNGALAQLVERYRGTVEAPGSIPGCSTHMLVPVRLLPVTSRPGGTAKTHRNAVIAQLVERPVEARMAEVRFLVSARSTGTRSHAEQDDNLVPGS